MRVLFASLVLAACSASVPPSGDGPSTPPRTHTRTTTVSTDSIVVDDPARRLTVRMAYPVLMGDAAGIDAVNEQLALVADQLWLEMAPEEPLGPDAGEWERYEFDGGYTVDYLSDDLVSLVQSTYAYTGGAHGNVFLVTQTFDLRTGRALDLDDVLHPSPAAYASLLRLTEAALVTETAARFETDEAEARTILWLDDLAPARETFDGRWTLGADSLSLHFAPYIVAPYVAGTYTVSVAYADLTGHLGPVAARLAAREDDASGD